MTIEIEINSGIGIKGDVGPSGPAGPVGPQGPAGPAGSGGGGGDNGTIAAIIVTTGSEPRLDADVNIFVDIDSLGATNALETDIIIDPDATGPVGPQGPAGPTGPTGPGVPDGGTTGQALVKTSNANQATGWATVSGGGGGSTRGFGYQKMRDGTAMRMFDASRVDSNEWNTYNRLCYIPIWVGWAGNNLQHFFTQVDTAQVGAVGRFGIYDAGLDGTPGNLLAETGTVAFSTIELALKSLAAPFQFPEPGLYFLAAVLQGTAGAKLARYVTSYAPFGSSLYGERTNKDTADSYNIPYQDAVSGALPAVASVSGYSNIGMFVSLRTVD